MNRLKRAAIITTLAQKMHDRGSWCGETHLQKAVYFLQDLLQIPTGFNFILYKHGPFSFDLRDELTSLRADELLRLEPQVPPYGSRITTTDRCERLKNLFPATLNKYEESIEFVAKRLGDKGVTELEQLATALFITNRKKPDTSISVRTEEFIRLKPHILHEAAQASIEEVDQMIEEAQEYFKVDKRCKEYA